MNDNPRLSTNLEGHAGARQNKNRHIQGAFVPYENMAVRHNATWFNSFASWAEPPRKSRQILQPTSPLWSNSR